MKSKTLLPNISVSAGLNAEDRDRIFNHLFSRALREVREGSTAD